MSMVLKKQKSAKLSKLSKLSTITALAVATMAAVGCRDFVVDSGASALSCTASSISVQSDAGMSVLDPNLGGGQIAQSFQPQSTVKNVSKVSLLLQAVSNNPSTFGNSYLSLSVVKDFNGNPDLSSPMTTAAFIPTLNVGKAPKEVQFTFGQPIAELTEGTTYWLVLNANYSYNNGHVVWLGSSANPYSQGQALAYDHGMWRPAAISNANTAIGANTLDLAFKAGCL